LLDWARQWNLEHPNDRIRIIGVDPQDNLASREQLGAFLEQAYGSGLAAQWRVRLAELAAADEQTAIFGDLGHEPGTAPVRHGDRRATGRRWAIAAPAVRRSRLRRCALSGRRSRGLHRFQHRQRCHRPFSDWYMALAILRAIDQGRTRPKAVFWAHNSHVSAAETAGDRPVRC
jgi:erythromycin esterase-like protein